MGAAAAMEMMKKLRDHTPELYEAHEGNDAASRSGEPK
jgi:hypothetical protein